MNKPAVVIPTLLTVLLLIVAGVVVFFITRVEMEDFSFRIIDMADGTPIEDVEIKVIENIYVKGYNTLQFSNDIIPTAEKLKKTFFTNEDGWANISLPKIARGDGYYVFKFAKNGYISQSGSSIFKGDTATDSWPSGDDACTVAFYSSANLSGVVKDPSGAPLEGVTVSVRFKYWDVDNFDVTGPDGRYELKNIRAGETNLTISGPGITSHHTNFVLKKFRNNHYDPVVNRTEGMRYNVTLRPEFVIEGVSVSVTDGELAMLFIRTNGDLGFEYCWGAAFLEHGHFNLSVQSGNYDLMWYYLGDEDYNQMDLVRLGNEYPMNELTVRSDIDLPIGVDLTFYLDIVD